MPLSPLPSVTLVPLGTTFLHAPLISHELLTLLEGALDRGEKTLLFYNRRGSGRAWICQDCGYFPLCPHCDIALAYHTSPTKRLICHHCGHIERLFIECLKCKGHKLQAIGIGIQQIEADIARLLPTASILRIDSDTDKKKSELYMSGVHHNIVISTYASLGLIHTEIDHIVCLLFESDLTLPDYRMEEEVYHALEYMKKSGKDLLIQTYLPEHPLLHILLEGNYRDFLHSMSTERARFGYPPYAEFALIRVHDARRERVQDIIGKLVNKISILKSDDIFLAYDRDITEKYAGEYIQKIILKGKDLSIILKELEVEIVKNRAVTLEWR